MTKTNKAQRRALKQVFDRCKIYPAVTPAEFREGLTAVPITYRQFRRGVQPGPGCVMVQWAGMWLGIEPDGYTHS